MVHTKPNGCGCSKGIFKYLKPPYHDMFYSVCCMHDDAYDRGGSEKDRRMADINLFEGMMKKSLQEGGCAPFRIVWMTFIAILYYINVRAFGWNYFNFKK